MVVDTTSVVSELQRFTDRTEKVGTGSSVLVRGFKTSMYGLCKFDWCEDEKNEITSNPATLREEQI